MPLTKPTACLFDLDGTLVQHKNERLIATLERYDTIIHILTKPFQKSGDAMPHEMDLTVNVQSNPFMHHLVHMFRRARGIDVSDVVEPSTHAMDVLSLLRKHNIPMGVTSNAYGRLYGEIITRKMGFAPFFEVQLFREHTKRGKPNPEPLLRAVKALKLDESQPQNIWYVGDQAKDMKAALAAQNKLPENWNLCPVAFRATSSTAYFYLSRLELDKICNQNYVRSFRHLTSKLTKMFT